MDWLLSVQSRVLVISCPPDRDKVPQKLAHERSSVCVTVSESPGEAFIPWRADQRGFPHQSYACMTTSLSHIDLEIITVAARLERQ